MVINPEQQDDGRIIYVASHPEFDEVLGTGETVVNLLSPPPEKGRENLPRYSPQIGSKPIMVIRIPTFSPRIGEMVVRGTAFAS